jgi:2,5-diketo-D-gluconate reductase A
MIRLNDGHAIPQLGFGVFQIEPEYTARAVGHTLEVGYRHIDTAQMYGNEHGFGEAVRVSGLDRADVFITSKLHNGCHRPDDARRAFDFQLEPGHVEQIDALDRGAAGRIGANPDVFAFIPPDAVLATGR